MSRRIAILRCVERVRDHYGNLDSEILAQSCTQFSTVTDEEYDILSRYLSTQPLKGYYFYMVEELTEEEHEILKAAAVKDYLDCEKKEEKRRAKERKAEEERLAKKARAKAEKEKKLYEQLKGKYEDGK